MPTLQALPTELLQRIAVFACAAHAHPPAQLAPLCLISRRFRAVFQPLLFAQYSVLSHTRTTETWLAAPLSAQAQRVDLRFKSATDLCAGDWRKEKENEGENREAQYYAQRAIERCGPTLKHLGLEVSDALPLSLLKHVPDLTSLALTAPPLDDLAAARTHLWCGKEKNH
ncbi:hypothetical protein JCM10449v2_005167 [Rhodotorula kratochvilovae]